MRRRLSVVSDNALIEGLESLSTDDGSTSGGSGGFISAYSGVSRKDTHMQPTPRRTRIGSSWLRMRLGASVLSVFDGHGEAGHLVSQQFKDKYAAAVFNSPQYKQAKKEGINAALETTSHCRLMYLKMIHRHGFSGTTAVTTIITMDKTLYCASWGLAYHAGRG